MKRLVALLAVGLLVAASAASVQAAPLFSVTNTTGPTLGNPPFTLGFQFTVNETVNVTALGLFDGSQNGFIDSHQVGLFDSGGALLASTTLSSGTGNPLIAQFRYADIAPVTLLAGNTYRIGALFLTGNDQVLFPGFTTGFVTDPRVAFVQSGFAFGPTLADPTFTLGTAPGFFGPNALISAVPEPTTLAAFGLMGAAGFGYIRRRLKAAPVAA